MYVFFAVMFMFVKNKDSPRSGNIFMWVGLFLGNGMLMCAYSMEWYARQTCPARQVGSSPVCLIIRDPLRENLSLLEKYALLLM